MNPNSENKWDAVNGIIKFVETRIDLQFQIDDLYNMKHMSPRK